MFIHDKPIEKEEDDFLGRARFSHHLGNSLLDWEETESLVIAIYGDWGSGKSSVINLARESIEKSNAKDKPTIIEFNPWLFSEQDNLSEHFFNEIAKELEIKQDSQKDKKIADKLKFYASLLNLTPKRDLFSSLVSKIMLGLGLFGVTASQIIQWLNIPYNWIKYLLFIIGFLLISIEIMKDYLMKFADIFEKKADYNRKSALEVKEEIKDELKKREKKLVVVIDDIDRLNCREIRQIFRLIRINADFPNTVYLLAFERNLIEKNLEEQEGVSGKDYLNKIVQVDFDIPFANPHKIEEFLFKELDRVLDSLPESAKKFFGKDDPYWTNVYHSGFKNFFKNIRDVKRFVSSLRFNISQMYQDDVMEVNSIDFIAIEAIRVFTPEFYTFMKNRNPLFTSTDRDMRTRNNNPRKNEIDEALKKLPNSIKKPVLELIKRLFPQIDDLYQYGYSSYGHEWQSTWSKKLRVCATSNFDSYFTLTPGGSEEELSQYEIVNILSKTNDVEEFEKILHEYIKNKKIRKVLQRIQYYADDRNLLPKSNARNIVQALFNISDDLPEKKIGLWDFGADMDLMRIIYQTLKRDEDKSRNYEILRKAIYESKGLYGPVKKIALESSKRERGKDPDKFLIPEDKISDLQQLCLEKILSLKDKLLEHKEFLDILSRWKEWDEDQKWKDFITGIINNNDKLPIFLSKFKAEVRSQAFGDYGVRRINKFNYKDLSNFADLKNIKELIEKIKKEDSQLYKDNAENFDLFLNNFESKNRND